MEPVVRSGLLLLLIYCFFLFLLFQKKKRTISGTVEKKWRGGGECFLGEGVIFLPTKALLQEDFPLIQKVKQEVWPQKRKERPGKQIFEENILINHLKVELTWTAFGTKTLIPTNDQRNMPKYISWISKKKHHSSRQTN